MAGVIPGWSVLTPVVAVRDMEKIFYICPHTCYIDILYAITIVYPVLISGRLALHLRSF